jgi:hypothetical protein
MTRVSHWAAIVATLCLLPSVATAEMIEATATFADGKGSFKYTYSGNVTTDNTVNNVVDAFKGMAGENWPAGWEFGYGGSVSVEHKVLGSGDTGYNLLVDGNYLSSSTNYTGTSTRHAGAWRDYLGVIDPGDPHTIQFTVRIDETAFATNFSTTNDRYEIHDRKDYAYGTTTNAYVYGSAYSTWGVTVVGNNKQWRVRSATGDVDTGVSVTPGTAYKFTLDFDPAAGANGLFDVKIETGGSTAFSGSGYGLNTAASDDVHGPYSKQTTGRLLFSTFLNKDSGDSNNTRLWSIDDIHITQVPEPTTLAMTLGILLMSLIGRRRR